MFRASYEEWALHFDKKPFDDLTIFEAELAAGMFGQGLRRAADLAWNEGDAVIHDKILELTGGKS